MCRFHRTLLSAEPSSQTESSAAASAVQWVIPNHWPLLQVLSLREMLLVGLFFKVDNDIAKNLSPIMSVKLLFNILKVSRVLI